MDEPVNRLTAPLDPLTEAVGQVILACAGLEAWVFMFLADRDDKTYVELERGNVEAALKVLAAEGDPIAPRLRGVFEARHALAHGAHFPNVDGTAFSAQRPQRGKEVTHETPWTTYQFDRPTLLAAAEHADELCGELQGRMIEAANE